ncbi:hypothetical protein [Neptunomonas qingdaonensis]|uniref:Uncharacterized protein n=1 Tax=Neptunomonas qingdaonensis TaxID=1045558 RepID=A0A1I2PCH8_9GAMM|nr:hypothetical protein [Neptunomonas qingdaonensis]SFG11376.1 hypothetical protein SAMN05216175_103280 [Neptunomonas qingdaonensis]
MPIANCFVTSNSQQGTTNLVELWAEESGKSSEHMTINIMYSQQQIGNQYAVMANLLLPSIWSASDISSLQIGLARALAKYFSLNLSEVHVTTTIISSGRVVENGEEVHW